MKGAIALADDKLYFGDYGGKVHAIRRSDGKKVWETSPSSGPLGLGGGNFYSSAAVEYGRVYIGSTNGNVYSLSSADGKLAWSRSTGGFVYASPAVGEVRGGRPTVYIGSYDGHFYALDARTGKPRWVRSLGTKISGAATIIGDLVFVSDLGTRTTWALGARTGRTVWRTNRGAFNPAISDGRRIYFTAYTSLFALDPKARPFDRAAASSAQSRAERARRRAQAAPQRAAQRGTRPCAPQAPHQVPLRGARPSPQREARLRAQLPPAQARLQGARQDDRAAPQPLPHAHRAADGARLGAERRAAPSRFPR